MDYKIKKIDFEFLVGQAVKAPSGHNAQPWLFAHRNNRIEIHPDWSKRLPVVDPDDRELFISLGCAAENLCTAAHAVGYETEVSVSEECVVRIVLSHNEEHMNDNRSFDWIAERQTNRNEYSGKSIPEAALNELASVCREEGIGLFLYPNGSEWFKFLKEFVREGNRMQMNDRSFREELVSWMRFGHKQTERLRDGLSYEIFGAPDLPPCIGRPLVKAFLKPAPQNKSDLRKIDSASHIAVFCVCRNTITEWVRLGMTLERILLKMTELGISHAYLNQPCEVQSLSEKLSTSWDESGHIPVIILRLGYSPKKAPYSKRRDIAQVILGQD